MGSSSACDSVAYCVFAWSEETARGLLIIPHPTFMWPNKMGQGQSSMYLK